MNSSWSSTLPNPSVTARFVAVIILSLAVCGPARAHPDRPGIIISTDSAIGLIDTHGGKSLSPVTFSSTYAWGNDTGVAPQDIDDGLVLAMALNMDRDKILDVLAVVPTFGNASLPAEMLVAEHITYELKEQERIPVVPGASSPISQILHATPLWFDGTPTQVAGHDGSFAAACWNSGVSAMHELLRASRTPVTLLALGPMTDIACLVNNARPSVLRKIREIIAIASRLEGESVQINGLVVNDFNFRMDPVAGALLLGADTRVQVPIRLMSFSLTGQTSQSGDLIAFNADSYPGPQRPNPKSERSFAWLLAAAEPRNAYWSGIFGTEEGPFDQYALIATLWPELFDCRPARAYVQQCPTPAWSEDFPHDADGNPTEQPYNADNNPCVDHGSAHGGSLNEVPAQLIVTLDTEDTGPLVRGETGVDGNIPNLDRPSRPVTACVDFAGGEARQEFEAILKQYTW